MRRPVVEPRQTRRGQIPHGRKRRETGKSEGSRQERVAACDLDGLWFVTVNVYTPHVPVVDPMDTLS
jgi:hypothetical protein